MNKPSVAAGNWSWRLPESHWNAQIAEHLAALVEITDRDNDPLGK
jgi:4-alpha-glucanotransferase